MSERLNYKEAATICGAVGAVSETIGIATGVTNHFTRHPMITAAHAMTMHALTGGRYALGIGRGISRAKRAFGSSTGHDRADGGLRRSHAAGLER